MMGDFKLKYQIRFRSPIVTPWMDEQTARKNFDQFKNIENCLWCELILWHEDEEHIVDEFLR